MIGLIFALNLSGLLRCMSLMCGLKSPVVFYVQAECCFHLDYWFKAVVQYDVILILVYHRAYLWTQSSQEEYMLVLISNVSTFTGDYNVGTGQCNSLIGALLY
jgi:hypothetical protein